MNLRQHEMRLRKHRRLVFHFLFETVRVPEAGKVWAWSGSHGPRELLGKWAKEKMQRISEKTIDSF